MPQARRERRQKGPRQSIMEHRLSLLLAAPHLCKEQLTKNFMLACMCLFCNREDFLESGGFYTCGFFLHFAPISLALWHFVLEIELEGGVGGRVHKELRGLTSSTYANILGFSTHSPLLFCLSLERGEYFPQEFVSRFSVVHTFFLVRLFCFLKRVPR